MPMDEIVSRYYVRFSVVDKPGVLAKIAAIFATAKIGISSVIQPEGHEGESVPLIFMIHDAPNAAMRKALAKIAKLPAVKGKPVMLRVENFEVKMSPLLFRSTNGQSPAVNLREALLAGQAPDRGLYFPEKFPTLTPDGNHRVRQAALSRNRFPRAGEIHQRHPAGRRSGRGVP